jgi:hypothetical protein
LHRRPPLPLHLHPKPSPSTLWLPHALMKLTIPQDTSLSPCAPIPGPTGHWPAQDTSFQESTAQIPFLNTGFHPHPTHTQCPSYSGHHFTIPPPCPTCSLQSPLQEPGDPTTTLPPSEHRMPLPEYSCTGCHPSPSLDPNHLPLPICSLTCT